MKRNAQKPAKNEEKKKAPGGGHVIRLFQNYRRCEVPRPMYSNMIGMVSTASQPIPTW